MSRVGSNTDPTTKGIIATRLLGVHGGKTVFVFYGIYLLQVLDVLVGVNADRAIRPWQLAVSSILTTTYDLMYMNRVSGATPAPGASALNLKANGLKLRADCFAQVSQSYEKAFPTMKVGRRSGMI